MLKIKSNVFPLVVLFAANLLVLISNNGNLRLAGGLLLLAMPGWILVNLVFGQSNQIRLLARLVLGTALGYVIVSLVVLGLSVFSVGISVWLLVAVLDAVSLALMAGSAVRNGEVVCLVEKDPAGTWIHVAILLGVFSVFRFVGLGFTEFSNGDEIPIFYLVQQLINGAVPSVLLEHLKGPGEVVATLAFVLMENGYNEYLVRFPFALASVVSGLLLYLLGREMFSSRAGFLAALLLALDGFYLSKSRWVEYQSLVVLAGVAAVYCFWRAFSLPRYRIRYLVLGSIFFGFGCLCHYGGIIVLPALAILYFSAAKSSWRRELLIVACCAGIVLVVSAPFYLSFFFSPALGEFRSQYLGDRLGWGGGVYNNLKQLVSFMLFTNSTYYVALMGLALVASLTLLGRKQQKSNPVFCVASVCFVFGWVISVGFQGLIRVDNIDYSLVLFLPMVGVLVWGKNLPFNLRTAWLWFIGGFVVFGFFARRPLDHWYVIVPPWALISGLVLDELVHWAQRQISCKWRWLAWVPVAFLVVLLGGYLYLFFLQRVPLYASTFPEHKSVIYWTPLDETPAQSSVLLVGTPAQSGMKVIGHLYRTGALRGSMRTAASQDTQEWYMGHKWDVDDNSRYMLFTGYGGGAYTREAIEQWYDLVGRVLVAGEPKLWLYERNDMTRGEPVMDYAFEEYETLYDSLVSLDEQLRFGEIGVDSKTYYRAAGLVEEMSKPGDEIVFTEREQVGLFSYHYVGDLPHHIPERAMEPADLEKWLREREGAGRVYIVYWAAGEGDERAQWDEWLGSVDGIRESAWHGNVGLGVYGGEGEVGLHLLEGSWLGESFGLLGYEVGYTEADGAVELVLYWAMEEYVWRDYTVFTHVLDDEGNMVGQKDNQPVGGMLPTSVWRTDKVVRDEYEISLEIGTVSGEYWIEVGMYDAVSGERLPASGEGTLPDGRIRLPRRVKVG